MDATEFCEAVKSLLYNLLGEHAARAAEAQARFNGTQENKQSEDDIEPLMVEICEGIVTHDKYVEYQISQRVFQLFSNTYIFFASYCVLL